MILSVVISGTNEAGSTVAVYDGTTLLGAATVSGTSWEYEASLIDGTTYALNAVETDSVGNPSSPTSDFTVISDTTAPIISDVSASWGSVLNSIEDNGDGTVTITTSGAEDSQTATLVLNSATYTGSVSNNTTSITVPAADLQALNESDTYTLSVDVSDAAGNAGAQHSSTTFSVDTTAPSAVLSSVADDAGSITGALSDGQSTDDTSVVISGTNEAGSTVAVYDGTTLLGAATVSGTSWTYAAALIDGATYALNAVETDSVGNPSSPTSDFTVTGDTTAPSAVLSSVADDVGSITGALSDGQSTDDTSVVISGTNEAGSTVAVYDGTTLLGAATVSGTSWTYAAVLIDGSTYALNAVETDSVGNPSSPTSDFTVTGDTTAPSAVLSSVADDVGSITGALSDGQSTDDTSVVISGTNEAGSTVAVYDGTTLLGAATVTATSWEYEASLIDGTTYALNAVETDSVGNPSSPTSDFTVIGDTTAPGKPTNAVSVAAASDGIISASEKSAGVSVSVDLDNTSAVAGETIELLLNGSSFTSPVTYVLKSADVDNGSVLIRIEGQDGWGSDGTKELSARVIDAVGNVGTASTELSVALESSPPDVSTVTSSTTDATYNIGDVVAINVQFDEVVTVTGAPQLTLETGDVDREVDYLSGSGTDTLLFNYTVQSGDASNDLAYGGVSALSLNSGTIFDNANNAATLTLPTVGGTGSLSNSSGLVIDGVRAAFTGGTVTAGTKSLVLSLGEAVSGTPDAGDFAVTVASASNTVTAVSVAGDGLSITLTLTDFVQNNNDVTAAYTANSDTAKLLSDAAGNTVSSNSSITVTRSNDTNSPDVLAVTSSTTDATYNIGDVVAINVQFDEVVTVTGAPQLTLETGDVDREVDYLSGSGTDTLLFNYTVQSGDASNDLAYGGVSALSLNSGTIFDNANNAATLTLPTVGGTGSLSNSSGLVIDGVRAAFTGGTVTAGTKSLVLSLGEAVSGTPDAGDFAVTVASASNTVTAVSVAGDGLSITLTLTDFVQNNNDVTAAYTANADTAKLLSDAAGNTVSSNSSITVTRSNDTNSPDVLAVTSSTTDATYNIGDVVAINVQFDEVVTVTGAPQLTLETGDVDREVDYLSGSGTDTLLFNYTVQSGDASNDLAYGGVSALGLNSGTIFDNANNAATLTLPTVGGTGSLSNSSGLVIDGVRAAFTGGTVTAGTKSLVLSLGEAVSGTPDAGDFAVTVASASNTVTAVSVAGDGLSITLTLTDFVQNNNDVTAAYTANSDTAKLLSDAAGNTVSSNSSITVTRSNDDDAPGAPDNSIVVSSAFDGINSTEVSNGVAVLVKLNGTNAQIGDTVEIILNGSQFTQPVEYILQSSDIDAGSTTINILTSSGWGSDGNKGLSARIIDSAGNIGNSGGALSIVLDTTAPIISDVSASWGSVLNSIEDNGDGTVTIMTSGAEDSQTVTLVLNSATYTGSVSNKTTSITVPAADLQALNESDTYTLSVDVSDAAGNAGTQHSSTTFSVDTTAPSAVLSSVADDVGSITGALSDGQSTDDTSVVISGTNEAGSTVAVYDGTTLLGTATVSGTSWTYAAALIDGSTYALNAVETDSVGNPSSPTSDFTVIGDTTAPSAVLSSVADDVGSITGALSDGQSTDDTAVVISGTNESGSTVAVYDGTTLLGAATVSGTSWTYAAALIDGSTYALNAVETDSVGNPSSPTSDFTVIGDTTAPIISDVSASWGSVLNSIEDNGDGTVTITTSGAEDSQTVTLVLNSATYTGSVSNNTTSITVPAADLQALNESDTYTLSVDVSDAAGNAGTQHSSTTFSVDTTAPSAVLSSVADDAGSITGALSDGQSTDDTSVVISGTNEAGSTVAVYDGTTLLGAATVSGTSWTYAAALIDGATYALNAVETDSVGNPSSPTSDFTVISDTTAPGKPTNAVSVAAASDGIISASEKSAGVSVSVDLDNTSAVAGETIELLLNGSSFTSPVISVLESTDVDNGSVSITINSGSGWGSDGTKGLSARVIDAVGNVGTASTELSVALEASPPMF